MFSCEIDINEFSVREWWNILNGSNAHLQSVIVMAHRNLLSTDLTIILTFNK